MTGATDLPCERRPPSEFRQRNPAQKTGAPSPTERENTHFSYVFALGVNGRGGAVGVGRKTAAQKNNIVGQDLALFVNYGQNCGQGG